MIEKERIRREKERKRERERGLKRSIDEEIGCRDGDMGVSP
jgi:hypothetical protein